MKKKNSFLNIINDDFSLSDIECDDINVMFSPYELSILLTSEPNSSYTDILLENMLGYFEEVELYEYCHVVFLEIEARKVYDF